MRVLCCLILLLLPAVAEARGNTYRQRSEIDAAVLPDGSRSREIAASVAGLLTITGLMSLWVLARERANGRFAPLPVVTGEPWLREHLLKYPAEIIGAVWDEDIGPPEVVALIARMVIEGKLDSEVKGSGAITLHLKVDRGSLEGHERTLVDRLFFDGRSTTSTDAVKQRYRKDGFNPVTEIKRELEAAISLVMPAASRPFRPRFVGGVFFVAGCGLLLADHVAGHLSEPRAIFIGLGALFAVIVAWVFGVTFQANVQYGRRRALVALVPAIASASGVAWFLWFYARPGIVAISSTLTLGLTALALATVFTTVNAMRSRRGRAAMEFRKMLVAAREFFSRELARNNPAVRHEWFPWVLALGLGKHEEDWSARPARPPSNRGHGGAAWASAVGGLAAGVSPGASRPSRGGRGW